MTIPSPKQMDDLVKRSADSKFSNYYLSTPAQAVGYWQLPGADKGMSIQYAAWKKPRWLTIKMMRWVFEWKWIEAK